MRRRRLIALALVVPVVLGLALAVYLLNAAGDLPWQEDPTRISTGLTPFGDIPGFEQPTPIPTRAP